MSKCVCNLDALDYVGDDYSLGLISERKPLNIKSYHICPECKKVYQVITDFSKPLHPEISLIPQFTYNSVNNCSRVEGFLLRDYDGEDRYSGIESIQKVIIKGFILVFGNPFLIQFHDIEDDKVFWVSIHETWDDNLQEYVYKKMPYFIPNHSVDTLNIIKKALNRKKEGINLINSSIKLIEKYICKIPEYIRITHRPSIIR